MSKKKSAVRGQSKVLSRTVVIAIAVGVVFVAALGMALANGTPAAPAKIDALATGRPAMYEFSTDS